jgi:molybdenum cofactor cytidylyltransferase
MKSRPAIIVLAAGRGSRFRGLQHKLEQSLGGSSVLGSTLSNALGTGLPVLVVTTEPLAELVGSHVATRDIVVLPAVGSVASQALGMGYSIAAGVAARSDASGWIMLPADMPMVQPGTLLAVAHELESHPIAYAQYRGRRGHPVGFAAELYSELVMLSGDEGARRLVARYPSQAVEADDPGVLLDVDTEDDLARVRVAQQASIGLGGLAR